MQNLRELNFQKCVEVLDDFHQALPVDGFDEALQEKKEQAELALKHMGELLKEEPDDEISNCSNCNGQRKVFAK